MAAESGFLSLRDRAYAAVVKAAQPVAEEQLLTHVYGGAPPLALRERLLAPLLDDPRLQRTPDGRWTTAGRADPPLAQADFTALALTTTGPHPARGRIVRLCALHVAPDGLVERFGVALNPGRRVPRYVAERAGLAPEVLDELPTFDSVVDDLVQFLAQRPICAQDAQLTWGFVQLEARRVGRTLGEPLLLDVNILADVWLNLDGKPSLGLVAQRLGISFTRIEQCDEEARIIGAVMPHVLERAQTRGVMSMAELARTELPGGPLRSGETARLLPDAPGVYVMRDAAQAAVYVGKARRLRTRLAAYVHRPLGATRRLEGLASAVHAVEAQECATDLEALILEEREIRRLQPRFNTVRRQRTVRAWIRLPPQPEPRSGKRQLAPARLELASGPEVGPGEYLGPFRNDTAAEYARVLARDVFGLDELRRTDIARYVEQLACAWAFLRGEDSDTALLRAREQHARSVATGGAPRSRLAEVRAYSLDALLLPADPRHARYAVVRPGPGGIEGFLIDRGVFLGWSVLEDDDVGSFAAQLLAHAEPLTTPADMDVVLRWLGAQRSTARLIHVADDPVAAADALEDAVAALLAADVAF